jgi:DNA polymerase-3 subunit epsilon
MRTPNHPLQRVVVCDTETGGIDPHRDSILSVALVTGDGDRQMEIFVREPDLRITPESRKIHGITERFIKANGQSPGAVCDALDAFVAPIGRKAIMAGHNIAFDVAFLRRLYRIANRVPPRWVARRTIDTQTLLWALTSKRRIPPDTTKSSPAFEHFGVAPPDEHRHSALGDALATRDLLEHIMEIL